ncbi:hypothetical protein HNQ51_002526 [Inhella inkyongensis]|uniref:Uncharacterized protein n=1 Tax=Inhella inkyongensis TaxID=392593 RepID=A0A840S215_9BURK|nr:hypothetical protein [Inhella inkyongensis]MBB5205207.1 hypothetical protein [Inhella inkyongensis]
MRLRTSLLLAALCGSASAADIGVSIAVSQPGVYGRIDIGRFPQPVLMQSSPVIIQPVRVRHEPVYMRVPPGHQKKWSKHCHSYNACGVPVYFVQEDWYQQNVMRGERYDHDDHGHDKHGKGHGKGHGKHKD